MRPKYLFLHSLPSPKRLRARRRIPQLQFSLPLILPIPESPFLPICFYYLRVTPSRYLPIYLFRFPICRFFKNDQPMPSCFRSTPPTVDHYIRVETYNFMDVPLSRLGDSFWLNGRCFLPYPLLLCLLIAFFANPNIHVQEYLS